MKKKYIAIIIILVIVVVTGLILWKQKEPKQKPQAQQVEYKGAMAEHVDGAVLLPLENVAKGEPKRLDIKLLFSLIPIEDSIIYEIKPGDTLSAIAKEFGTTVDLIRASNSLKSETIKPGQKLKIINGEFKIAVNVSNNTLSLFLNDKLVKIYPVGTAKNRDTPLGEFKIINRVIEPTWYAPDGVYAYGDSKNIIGTRWMGIDESGYGIHGTTEPESIGKYVSAGCIRMHNEDVEELFKIVPVGTKININEGN